MQLGILGGGSWGTALAILWARYDHQVTLWVRNGRDATRFSDERRNTKYLPDFLFPENLAISADLAAVAKANKVLGVAVPLQAYRTFLEDLKPHLSPEHRLILLSKGIELNTLSLPTAIVTEVLGADWAHRTYALSGPSFAREVAEDKPTTVVLAGPDSPELQLLQETLNAPTFRMYRTEDVVGVELGGALKNVIAIASGMVRGLGLGHNTTAGLITRGLAEITRVGMAMGAQAETFSGLAGIGDLILTCTGALSRNFRVGKSLAEGHTLEQTMERLGMVAEGVHTCRAARDLGIRVGVEMPLTEVVYEILYEQLPPRKALHQLMTRRLKAEA